MATLRINYVIGLAIVGFAVPAWPACGLACGFVKQGYVPYSKKLEACCAPSCCLRVTPGSFWFICSEYHSLCTPWPHAYSSHSR